MCGLVWSVFLCVVSVHWQFTTMCCKFVMNIFLCVVSLLCDELKKTKCYKLYLWFWSTLEWLEFWIWEILIFLGLENIVAYYAFTGFEIMFAGLLHVYRYAILVVDFFYLCYLMVILSFKSLFYLIVSKPMKSVSSDVVLITGTGHGIGRELALQFARLGAKVVCVDINEVNNKKTVTDIGLEGGTAWGYKCDVSKKQEVHTVCQKIREEIGQVTILINNAAILACKSFIKYSAEDIEKIFNINVLSHIWMIREWLPFFITSKKGHVVSISSIAGLMATGKMVPYCASKFALRGIIDGLRQEYRYIETDGNLRFTSVHPFVVDTGFVKKPRIRMPSLNPITSAADCAEKIIEGVRREEDLICIPSKDYYGYKLLSLMPIEMQKAVFDFLATGVDEDES